MAPYIVVAGVESVVSMNGTVETPTTRVGLSMTSSCASGDLTVQSALVYDSVNHVANLTLSSSLASGVYTLCYSVNAFASPGAPQSTKIHVITANANSIANLSPPSVPFHGLARSISTTSAVATPQSHVAVSPDNTCAVRYGTTHVTSSTFVLDKATDPPSPGTFKVCFSTDGGATWVAQSSVSIGYALAPGVIGNATAIAASASMLNVGFATPAEVNFGPIEMYHVVVTSSSGESVNVTSSGDSTSVLVTGLKAATAYNVSITARNSAGDSPPVHVAATTLAATVPGSSSNGAATTWTAATVRFTWSAPIETGGLPVNAYNVTISGGSHTATWTVNEPSARAIGLAPSMTYTVSILAGNSIGFGAPHMFMVATAAGNAPGAPLNPTLVSKTYEMMTVRWVAPEDDGDWPVESYVLIVNEDGKNATRRVAVGGNGTEASVRIGKEKKRNRERNGIICGHVDE